MTHSFITWKYYNSLIPPGLITSSLLTFKHDTISLKIYLKNRHLFTCSTRFYALFSAYLRICTMCHHQHRLASYLATEHGRPALNVPIRSFPCHSIDKIARFLVCLSAPNFQFPLNLKHVLWKCSGNFRWTTFNNSHLIFLASVRAPSFYVMTLSLTD